MENKFWFRMLLIFSGMLPLGQGLHYFIGGEAYRNSDLRNYAVVGQIIFGLAIVCCGFLYRNNSEKQSR